MDKISARIENREGTIEIQAGVRQDDLSATLFNIIVIVVASKLITNFKFLN